MATVLKDIEINYPVLSVRYKGITIWPALRIYAGNKIVNQVDAQSVSVSLWKTVLFSFFYGFLNLFRKYDYVCFSDSLERKNLNGKMVDKSMDPVASVLTNTLLVELPLPKHYNKNKVPTKYLVSKIPFYFFEQIYSLLFLRNGKWDNREVLDRVCSTYGITWDYASVAKKVYAQYVISKLYFKYVKPKAVFVECFYTNSGRVYAAKELGIKIIEIQHGIISANHLAYTVYSDQGTDFFPDYLLTFGEKEKTLFGQGNYLIKPDHVFPLGHFYLDKLSHFAADTQFVALSQRYLKTVAITGQDHESNERLLDFIITSAQLTPNVLFIYIPRRNKPERIFPDNVRIIDWMNTYEIIASSDIHTTVFSTCAQEAPSLGIVNFLIDIDGLASLHWKEKLNESEYTYYFTSPHDFVNQVLTFEKPDKDKVKWSNRNNIKPDYQKNLIHILKEVKLT